MAAPSLVDRPACPACGGSHSRALLRAPFADPDLDAAMRSLYADVGPYDPAPLVGATYAVDRCEDCGLVFQSQVPDDALLRLLYDEWHDPEKTRARLRLQHTLSRSLEISREVALAWKLARRPDEVLRMLDYGCGHGQWAVMARGFGAETWGMDYSPARKKHCAELGLRMADESDLPADYFDYIHLDQVLEHVVRPREMLGGIVRLLRPGGVVCVAVPSARRVPAAIGRWRQEAKQPRLGELMPIAPLLHLNGFDHDSLRGLGLRCGLSVIKPGWRPLFALLGFGPTARATAKAFAKPFYLRGPRCTRLYFRRPEAA